MKKRSIVYSWKLRVLAMVLAVLTAFYVVPLTAFAEAAGKAGADAVGATDDGAGAASDSAFGLNVDKTVFEVEELREANVKHFRLEDGSYLAATYPSQIHRLDENGLWQDIDNSLSYSENEVTSSDARIKFAKKITGNGTLFTLHDKNAKITMALEGAIKKTEAKITTAEVDESGMTELGKLKHLENLNSSLIYENILDGVDIEYVLNGLNIKENIIVKERQDNYSYSFKLSLNNLTATLGEDGSVSIVNGDGEAEYLIPAPLVYDANGVRAPGSAASYTLTDLGSGKYNLTVTASPEWMNAEERAFPITVDPTIQEMLGLPENIMMGVVLEEDVFFTESDYVINETPICLPIMNYNTSRLYIASTLPSIGANATVTSAHFYLRYVTSSFTQYTPVLRTVKVVSAWDWNLDLQAHYNGAGAVGNVIETEVEPTEDDVNLYELDVTDLASEWYSGESSNFGIGVELANTDVLMTVLMQLYGDYSQSTSSGTATPTPTPTPVYTISYVKSAGLESYWSYSGQSAGNAGEGNVNLSNGNLVYTLDTLSTTDSIMPLTLSLVYNNCHVEGGHTATSVLAASHTSFLPAGYKLNIDERIVEVEVNGATKYILSDSDGTEHYYSAIEGQTTSYLDESGKRTKLDTSSKTSYLYITDVSNTKKTFERFWTSEYYETDVWILTKIEDKHGNSVSFTMDSKGRPTAVSFTPKSSSAIPMLKLAYNSSGKLSLVYNLSVQRGVKLEYTSDSLTQVKYLRGTHGTTTESNWVSVAGGSAVSSVATDYYATLTNTSGRITSVTDSLSGCKLVYTYSSTGKVTSAKEYGRGGVLGQTVNFVYGSGYTDVKTSGSDDTIETADDLTTRYVFDSEGRAISNYSTLSSGYLIYDSVLVEYEEQSNIKNNVHKITNVGNSPSNYLVNGSFDAHDGWFINYWAPSSNVTYDYGSINNYGTKINMIVGATDSVYQHVEIDKGEYTLSFDYITANVSPGSTAVITADSVTTDGTQTRIASNSIVLNQNTRSEVQCATLQFNVSADNTVVKIEIEVFGATVSGGYMVIDNVMLSDGLEIKPYNYVQLGHFDFSSVLSNGLVLVDVAEVWHDQSGSRTSLYQTNMHPFFKAGKVAANYGTSYIIQNVFTVEDSLLAEYDANGVGQIKNNDSVYLLSGYGYADSAALTTNGEFELRADVYYYQGIGKEDVCISHSFEFEEILSTWQFTAGRFSLSYEPEEGDTNDYSLVRYINIVCDFSTQADGVAYFDNISLTETGNEGIVEYTYYDDGNIESVQNVHEVVYYTYKSGTNLVSRQSNSRGEVWDYTYNSYGDLIKEEYSIIEEGNEIKTPKNLTTYDYSNTGLLLRVYKQGAIEQTNGTSVYGDEKLCLEYTYDESSGSKIYGTIITETDGLGNTTKYFYDTATLLLIATVNLGTERGMYYTYDSRYRLQKVTPVSYTSSSPQSNENSSYVTYEYDAYGNLSKISTPNTYYTFAYDAYGNSSAITSEYDNLVSYEYYPNNGKIRKVIFGNGFSEDYVYDVLENLTEVWYTYDIDTENERRIKAIEYSYTSEGMINRVDDLINGLSTVYSYDENGRIESIVEASTDTLRNYLSSAYTYEEEKVKEVAFAIDYSFGNYSGLETIIYDYTYYSDGSVDEIEVEAAKNLNITYLYDGLKRLCNKVYTLGSFNTTIEYGFASSNSNTSYQVSNYSSTIGNYVYSYDYSYDSYGNIVRAEKYIATESNDGRTLSDEVRYTYDAKNQLIREDNSLLDTTYLYAYDKGGNRIYTKAYFYTLESSLESMNPISERRYEYAGDEMTQINGVSIDYDTLGNPIEYIKGSTTYSLVWDGWQLKSVTTSDGKTYTFTYNADGLRTSKTYTNGSTVEVTNYYYIGNVLIAEEIEDGFLIIYLYDEAGSPIGVQMGMGDTADVYYYEKNLQGDVVAIYDHEGTKLISYKYDAWGNFVEVYLNSAQYTTAILNSITYRGYYYDRDLEFYYLGSRYYDAEAGRFISPDSVEYLGANGDLISYNLYAYCSNNPVNKNDPTGHAWDIIFDIAFICWDIYDLVANEGYKEWENWASLGLDVAFAAIPFLTGGGGQVVKLADVGDALYDLSKVTVIGETMTRVKTVSQFVNATDNLYDGFKSYGKLSSLGKGGKALAEIGGKASNLAWLYGKVRCGYTVVDIGIDIGRTTRSSSYITEKVFLGIWKHRNKWKLLYHIWD